MTRLKAMKPENIKKRLKLFEFGSYKVGKTLSALSFPRVYLIDTERGAVHDQYVRMIRDGGSAVLQSSDVDEITEEVRSLGTEKHDYQTLVIDPITTVETDLIEKAEKQFGAGDMRIWGLRDRKLKRLINLMNRLDMNVILTAHGKIDYGPNMVKLGTTYDGWKRWPYEFDLILELERRGTERMAIVRGTRLETFTDGEAFPWSYAEFQRRYPYLDAPVTPVILATAEQVRKLQGLLETIRLPEDTLEKWLSKAQVEAMEDMSCEQIEKCIKFCEDKFEVKK